MRSAPKVVANVVMACSAAMMVVALPATLMQRRNRTRIALQ